MARPRVTFLLGTLCDPDTLEFLVDMMSRSVAELVCVHTLDRSNPLGVGFPFDVQDFNESVRTSDVVSIHGVSADGVFAQSLPGVHWGDAKVVCHFYGGEDSAPRHEAFSRRWRHHACAVSWELSQSIPGAHVIPQSIGLDRLGGGVRKTDARIALELPLGETIILHADPMRVDRKLRNLAVGVSRERDWRLVGYRDPHGGDVSGLLGSIFPGRFTCLDWDRPPGEAYCAADAAVCWNEGEQGRLRFLEAISAGCSVATVCGDNREVSSTRTALIRGPRPRDYSNALYRAASIPLHKRIAAADDVRLLRSPSRAAQALAEWYQAIHDGTA